MIPAVKTSVGNPYCLQNILAITQPSQSYCLMLNNVVHLLYCLHPEEVLAQMIEDQQNFVKAGLMPESNPYFELQAKLKMQKTKEIE